MEIKARISKINLELDIEESRNLVIILGLAHGNGDAAFFAGQLRRRIKEILALIPSDKSLLGDGC